MGVSRDAKLDEIKKVYRKLARKYHPDVSKEANAEEKFKELQEAYNVLKDSEKRSAYDQLGSDWQSGQEFRPPPEGTSSQYEFRQDGGDFSDFFESLFGGGGFTSRRSSRQGFAVRGEDLHSKISISLEDAHHGAVHTIRLQVPELDKQTGQLITKLRTLKIKIPVGVTQGQQIRLAGQGGEGFQGAPNGDLYLEIDIKPHHVFRIENKDVFLTLPIAPWEAALGAKIAVPTLAGKVELTIPAGVQSGQKLRLKGKGLLGKSVGDQYVILKIMTPIPKNEEQRKLYETMAKEMPFNPRVNMEEVK